MLRSAHFQPFRQAPVWLLAFGLFAMAMQVLGGIGIMPRSMASGSFLAEVCTSKGIVKRDLERQSGSSSLPDSGHQDCCVLCAASAPVLLAHASLGVPPAPTFRNAFIANPLSPPPIPAWLLQSSRGPPLA